MNDREAILAIRLQPSAKVDEICGFMSDGILKIRVRNKPVEGKANEGLIQFLSKSFNIPRSQIAIIGGEKSRNKRVKLQGISDSELRDRLKSLGFQEP